MENIDYKPLTYDEIVYSGAFTRKLYRYLNQLNNVTKERYFNIFCEGKEISFSCSPTTMEWLKESIEEETNTYLRNIINNVDDEEYRNLILKFSQNEKSRKSNFHILNIEVLCFSANSKPERFPFILDCVKDEYTLTHDTENYEFYVFAILDAPTNEKANEILDALLEREISQINRHDPEIKRIANMPEYVKSELGEKSLQLVYENLDKLRIV